MLFSINRDVLLNNLIHLQKGLPSKSSPLPILNSIKFLVYSDYVELVSSNSDIAIQVTIDDSSLNVIQAGSFAVPGKTFIEIVRKINANLIQMELVEDRILIIKADRSEFKLRLMDVLDYPEIDFAELNDPLVFDAEVISEIIRETYFATAEREKRPILTGVNFKYADGQLLATATDSYRLSQKKIKLKSTFDDFSIVVPSKSLEELSKILDSFNEEVQMYIQPNKVLFKFGKVLYQTRLLEGTYPDTSRIIPNDFILRVSFNKDELLQAVDRVSVLSPRDREQNYNIIKLRLNDDHSVEITSNNTEVGGASDTVIPSGEVEGKAIQIAFSSKYLVEALKSYQSSEITLNFSGDIKPFVITGNYDVDLLHLILPVRID